MKKNILVLLFLCLFSITIVACNGSKSKVRNTISFSELKEIANKRYFIYGSYNNISGKVANLDYTSVYVPCLDSQLVVEKSTSLNRYVLKTFDDVVLSSSYNRTYFSNKRISVVDYVYYDSTIPMVLFEESDVNAGSLYFCDSYGTEIMKYQLQGNTYLNNIDTKYVGDYTYIRYNLKCGVNEIYLCFRFKYNNYKYEVEKIDEDAYNLANVMESGNQEFQDSLVAVYDSKGKIFAYTYYNNSELIIYNSKKEYLNSVDLNSFGFSGSKVAIRLEKKLVFIKSEIYYEKEMERGSKDTYKSRCLEIDLTNGKMTYDDDFKYYVFNAETINDGDKFKCSLVKIKELNDKGELSDETKGAILKNKFSFNDSFVYESFFNNMCLLDDNTIYAKGETLDYLITKDERIPLKNFNIITIFDDRTVVYQNQDEKYYLCKISDLTKAIRDFSNGYAFVSGNKYNGDNIKISIGNNNELVVGNLTIDSKYFNLAQKGIFVTSDSIYVGGELITTLDSKITNITVFASSKTKTIYIVNFENSSTPLFFEYDKK